jgi:hypothetical protein
MKMMFELINKCFIESFLNEEMIHELHDFEEKAFYEYNHASQIARKEKMEERVHNTSNK